MSRWKNFLLLACVRIFSKFLRKHPHQQRILVVSTTALGDTLWATPALTSLRDSFPGVYLAVLTSPIGKQVLQSHPALDRLFVWPRFLPISLWRRLYRERFDTILLFHTSQRLIPALCSLLGASKIVATRQHLKGLESLVTNPLPPKPQHEIARRLAIIEAIGAKKTTESLQFFFSPPKKAPLLPSSARWIALHPGSKDPFKRWPMEQFAWIGNRLKETFPCEILITGVASERPLLQELAAQIPHSHLCYELDPEMETKLARCAMVLQQMHLLICNDTGILHLASALKVPLIGIYTSTDSSLCGPYKMASATIIQKKTTCNPCLKKGCKRPFCFWQINREEVWQKALEKLSQT